ncbi:conserved hypothetical protein [Vibrio jasicida]|uniref:Uncharacterized protein n=1 Tax=Vibrio jasicida TaxID=766224 RepID=A0AAU9R0C8_9VIBR|nr:conserved hypothetical protein [Vibrio jasicida]CAH1603511.1 conserved hypothetical protein [Vibrio jasicida]
MIYLDNFFTPAKPDEELYECSNDFTSVDRLAQSFLYHVKGNGSKCATDTEREYYRQLANRCSDPMDLIESIKMMPTLAAIKELETL